MELMTPEMKLRLLPKAPPMEMDMSSMCDAVKAQTDTLTAKLDEQMACDKSCSEAEMASFASNQKLILDLIGRISDTLRKDKACQLEVKRDKDGLIHTIVVRPAEG